MKVLVCVKRVPMTGGRIVLTEDGLAIETKHLGFAVSPHEECGVEEAVRLVEQHGGESVVLTLGPADAEEQLRDAMAIGIDRGIHLVTGGEEWDPEATAGAIVEAIRADEAASGPFDLIFFGNESADSGGFQVGLRRAAAYLPPRSVARALGRPCATGLKSVVVEGGIVRCEQEIGGGRDVYELPLPAVLTVLEGLNLPRYPSVPGRMRAGRKPLEATTPDAARVAARAVPARGAGGRGEAGRGARPRAGGGRGRRRPARADRGGVVNLVLVEHADGVATDVSLQALALAAGARWRDARAADRAWWCRGGGRACRWPWRTLPSTRRSTRSRPTPGPRSSAGSPTGSARPRSSRRAPGRRPTRWPARPFGSASRSPPTSPPSRRARRSR